MERAGNRRRVSDPGSAAEREFPFRPWVSAACRRALYWGMGVVVVLGGVSWALRSPDSEPLGRAFGVLALYGLLFLASLLKILWTARGPAAVLDRRSLSYQPLHTFRPRRIELDSILACAPRPGTQSLRFVYRAGAGHAREFFLNLAVIDGRTALLHGLGRELEARGLVQVPQTVHAWRHPTWSEE